MKVTRKERKKTAVLVMFKFVLLFFIFFAKTLRAYLFSDSHQTLEMTKTENNNVRILSKLISDIIKLFMHNM